MLATLTSQLDAAIREVCPISGISVNSASPAGVTFDPLPEATPAQIAAAQGVIDGWDYSQAAEDARTAEEERELAKQLVEILKTPQGRALRAIVALLVNGQEAELNRVYRRFREQDVAVNTAASLGDLKTKWNTLATTYPMPNRTMLQALNAVKAEITGNA